LSRDHKGIRERKDGTEIKSVGCSNSLIRERNLAKEFENKNSCLRLRKGMSKGLKGAGVKRWCVKAASVSGDWCTKNRLDLKKLGTVL